tara:strand:- start:314 stop:460 length:147 start_codon:yes stop_codon:yes gene_type:complete
MTPCKIITTALATVWLAIFFYWASLTVYEHQSTVAERLSAEHARRIDN